MTLKEFEDDELTKLFIVDQKYQNLEKDDVLFYLIKRIAFVRWEAKQNLYKEIYEIKYGKKFKPGPDRG